MDTFTTEELAAMKERAAESKAPRGKKANPEADLAEVLAKIEAMPEPDRSLAQRVHETVLAAAPELKPKTWYGMPAYAKNGKVICFFQNASKFKSRYSTLGFSDSASLDRGVFWPNAYALLSMDKETEQQITQLVKRAVE